MAKKRVEAVIKIQTDAEAAEVTEHPLEEKPPEEPGVEKTEEPSLEEKLTEEPGAEKAEEHPLEEKPTEEPGAEKAAEPSPEGKAIEEPGAEKTGELSLKENMSEESAAGFPTVYKIVCRNKITKRIGGVDFMDGEGYTLDGYAASWFAGKDGYTVESAELEQLW